MPGWPRILIVDDERPLADVLAECVEGDGAEVEIAGNGREALAAVGRSRPDIVLLDMNMPGLSGLDVLRRLRDIDRTIPVLLITATADDRAIGDALEAGAFSYIPKPFNPTYIRHLVASALTSPQR